MLSLAQVILMSGREGAPFDSSPSKSAEINPTQKKMLDYIAAHPGVHLREICRSIGIAMGDAQFNVNKLEKSGRVISVRRGLYRFFYSSAVFGQKERDLLSILALDTPRELLLHILGKPDSTQEELAFALAVSQPTISWHLKRLSNLGIIERQQSGSRTVYKVAGVDAAEVALLLRSYHPGVWEKWSSRLADIFISYSSDEAEGAP